MRYRLALLWLCVAIGGCSVFSNTDDMHYSIYFQPYSADLDPQGHATARAAAEAARANPGLPIFLAGYAAPPDPSRDIDGLSALRTANVKQALVRDGVGPDRITSVANGITDPNGKPNLAVRRVDISIGR